MSIIVGIWELNFFKESHNTSNPLVAKIPMGTNNSKKWYSHNALYCRAITLKPKIHQTTSNKVNIFLDLCNEASIPTIAIKTKG
ncbi:hypothetical protein FM036_30950 [Nostoc sp. HG1]|nr:hypothetical protein [Nostoc sp. HG1]